MSAEITRIVSAVRQARGSAFETHSKPLEYTVNRGISSYENDLPTFRDRPFIDIVDKKLEEKTDGKPLVIVDIGCGNGEFLASCARRWPGKVSCIGITSEVYPNKNFDIFAANRIVMASGKAGNTYDPLNAIEIIKGDALNIVAMLEQRKADIAVALQSFRYFADPWMVLKRVYSVLSKDGICLIDAINLNLRYDADLIGADRAIIKATLAKYLRDVYDMEVSSSGFSPLSLSFIKTSNKLSLPLRYFGKRDTYELREAIDSSEKYEVVEYELNREKAKNSNPLMLQTRV